MRNAYQSWGTEEEDNQDRRSQKILWTFWKYHEIVFHWAPLTTKLDQRGSGGTFDVYCWLWIDNRQLEFTADYGLIIGSYGFYCRLWIENPSGCKLVMAAQRGISVRIVKFCVRIAKCFVTMCASVAPCRSSIVRIMTCSGHNVETQWTMWVTVETHWMLWSTLEIKMHLKRRKIAKLFRDRAE